MSALTKGKSMARAVSGLQTGRFASLSQASKHWRVSKSTLAHRLNRHLSRQEAHEGQQEQALIAWIHRWSAQGFPVRHDILYSMAQHIVFSRSDTGRRESAAVRLLGHNWVQRFIKRHRNLQSIIAKPLKRFRRNACTLENLKA
jgi:hypothetical protein